MTRRVSARAGAFPEEPIAWLLKSNDPSVRFLTLTEVVGASPRSREARRAQEAIPNGERVRALLRGQGANGGFGVHPYRKWTGAHWRLVSLVELAIPSEHPGAVAAAETVLGWLTGETFERGIVSGEPRVRLHASIEGNAVAVCSRLGIAGDERVRRLVDVLMRAQWADGGWNCDPDPAASHSSFHETLPTMWGLAEFARATGDPGAAEAADRAAELLLSHRLFRSHRTGEIVDPEWVRLHYPPYWHYDVLQALLVLSRHGRAKDLRAKEAVRILEDRRRPDGRWNASGRRYWRAPGSRSGNEVVDWGPDRPSEMITLNALRVLAAVERL